MNTQTQNTPTQNPYLLFKENITKTIDEMPMGFAFNKEQMAELKIKLGAKDNDDLVRMPCGGIALSKDGKKIQEQFEKFNTDL